MKRILTSRPSLGSSVTRRLTSVSCRRYGVGLRLNENGRIALDNYDRAAWPSLFIAIGAHAEQFPGLLITIAGADLWWGRDD